MHSLCRRSIACLVVCCCGLLHACTSWLRFLTFVPSLQALSCCAIMPSKAATDCAACGAELEVIGCEDCDARLKGKGTCLGLCAGCLIADVCADFGEQMAESKSFRCKACMKAKERLRQEEIFQKLKGPDPERILKTVAGKFPWALEIAKASPEELLEALQFLKRKLSGHRTVAALAESLANSNAQAALLIQQLGRGLTEGIAEDSMTTRVLRTFVKNQCPVVKYKALLLPPSGSLYKTIRHFQDMLKVEDKLVVALAQERLFLCEWAETHFRPQPSDKQRKRGDFPEVPEIALRILRATFKSLSAKVKNAALRDEDANLMVKVLYADHFEWAHSQILMKMAESGRGAQVPRAEPWHMQASEGRAPGESFAKGGKKGSKKRGPEVPSGSYRSSGSPQTARARRTDAEGKVTIVVGDKQLTIDKTVDRLIDAAKMRPPVEVVKEMFATSPDSTRLLFTVACRNCFLAGNGLAAHSFGECKALGNKCVMHCPKCRTGVHWIFDCKEP
jgi:hypothetical protein